MLVSSPLVRAVVVVVVVAVVVVLLLVLPLPLVRVVIVGLCPRPVRVVVVSCRGGRTGGRTHLGCPRRPLARPWLILGSVVVVVVVVVRVAGQTGPTFLIRTLYSPGQTKSTNFSLYFS